MLPRILSEEKMFLLLKKILLWRQTCCVYLLSNEEQYPYVLSWHFSKGDCSNPLFSELWEENDLEWASLCFSLEHPLLLWEMSSVTLALCWNVLGRSISTFSIPINASQSIVTMPSPLTNTDKLLFHKCNCLAQR